MKIVRDGLVYDTIVEVAEWVYENGGAEQTEQDKKRVNEGMTHIGSRQPWL